MKKRLAILLIIVLALLLAACSSGVEDVPSLRATATPVVEEVSDDEAKVVAFAQCMRDQGIEYKDPVVDFEGNVQQPEFVEGFTYTRAELAAPYKACSHHIEGLTFGQERQDPSEQIDQYIELVACLRDKGYDVDDPTAETLQTWLSDFRVEYDWDDPEAMADYEECNRES